jgi:hypothetical protein
MPSLRRQGRRVREVPRHGSSVHAMRRRGHVRRLQRQTGRLHLVRPHRQLQGLRRQDPSGPVTCETEVPAVRRQTRGMRGLQGRRWRVRNVQWRGSSLLALRWSGHLRRLQREARRLRGVRQNWQVQGLRRQGLHMQAVRQEVPKVRRESRRLRGLWLRDGHVHQVPGQR